ncbi:DUF4912 domain-containing protein [Methylacidiphilum caldifontis]|uniref:DUF4912 domain-containing protein n=1 Tax=Methylacidiphilum caldifontis TaxID=2795386 RepID=A0A4Y8P8M0_9BACT|nr:DUF4912 domain-containing protein [Methylacidiphilum caldifontis]TFE66555.1 hypothetical protein A7Q10_01925 [Methylacidiphilum caldifontis]
MSKKSEKKSKIFHKKPKAHDSQHSKVSKAKEGRIIDQGQAKTLQPTAQTPSPKAWIADSSLFPSLLSLRKKKPLVYLFALDPYSLYAYWIVEQEEESQAHKRQWVLRFVKHGSSVEAEYPLEAKIQKQYYSEAKPNTPYHAEIGFYSFQHKKFYLVARSSEAITPPDSLFEKKDIKFATIPPGQPFQELIASAGEKEREKAMLAEAFVIAEQQTQDLLSEIKFPQWEQSSKEKGDIFDYIDYLAVVEDILSFEDQSRGSSHSLSFPVQREDFIQLERASLFEEENALFDFALSWPASFAFSSPPLPLTGIESSCNKNFPLEIEVELVLRGKTLPKALLQVKDKEITLNEDGSFVLQLPFPEGYHEIPIEAKSLENQQSKKLILFCSLVSHSL